MENILQQICDTHSITFIPPTYGWLKEKKMADSQRKAKVLLNIAQRYYLEIWLMVQEKYGVLTFPSDLYRRDYVTCPWARARAKKQVSEIIKNGHLNRNYNRLITALSNSNLSISGFVYKLARARAV